MARLKIQKLALNIAFYREGNKFIAYSPALDFSTCGDTQEQAQKRFREALEVFLEEVDRMGTLENVLSDCGWRKVNYPHRHWEPPRFVGQSQQEVRIPCPA